MSRVDKRPSEEAAREWVYSRPPKVVTEALDAACLGWFVSNADDYVKSGRLYPRDIRMEDPIIPTGEPELTLRKIDLEAITQAKRYLTEGHFRSELDSVLFHSCMAGKWLVFVSRNEIDKTWRVLSSAVEGGRLPYPAKVSTLRDNGLSDDKERHVICVYTHNFLFRADVRECRRTLKEMGFNDVLYYKPDIMTYKRIYRKTGSSNNHRYYW